MPSPEAVRPKLIKKSSKRKTDKEIAKDFSNRDQYRKLKSQGSMVLAPEPRVTTTPTQRSQKLRMRLNKRKDS